MRTGVSREMADWLLALLTALVWSATYGLFFLRDAETRRKLRLWGWRLRHRLRRGRPRPRPVPRGLARPSPPVFVARSAPPRPARPAASQGAAALAVADPVRIAEWRVDNLPMRYRLLGRVRRGANDN